MQNCIFPFILSAKQLIIFEQLLKPQKANYSLLPLAENITLTKSSG